MMTRTILAGVLLAVASVAGEDEWQLEAEGKVRSEYEKAEDAALPDSWKADLTKWRMADDPSPQLVKRARQILDAKGVVDTDQHGAILYDVGGGRHVLMIMSTKSAGRIAKYYCLGYARLDHDAQEPERVWIKYIEYVRKFKDAAIPDHQRSGSVPKEPVSAPDLTPAMPENKVAIWVPGKPGFVFNPYTNNIVDVRGFPLGSVVKDPSDSDKRSFRIPSAIKN